MDIKQKISENRNTFLLLLILLVAAILRFYRFWDIPFMFDEFSAIFRTHYDNFSDLIEFGVMKKDMHPAGIQVFLYYWTDIFGYTEWILKLPFIVMGILSVWLSYKIGRHWFGNTAGLLTAATMAVLQYTIMYSQLIRMYSSGLFFGLLMVYCWSQAIDEKTNKRWLWLGGWIIGAVLASYNHAFSLFFAAIVGVTGLFIIPKKLYRDYIISGVIIILLYLPHLNILLYHLNVGGVGGPEGWLSPPDASFFFRYLSYIFNYSIAFLILFILLFSAGLIFPKKANARIIRFRIIALLWFLVPVLTGYFYSIYRNPVLQFSVVIFSFPFLLLFVYSFLAEMKFRINAAFVFIILLLGSYTLIYGRQHYEVFYKQGFDRIPLLIEETYENYPEDETATYLDVGVPKMINFYFDKYDIPKNEIHYLKERDMAEFREMIGSSRADRVIYAWTDGTALERISMLRDHYPYLLRKEVFFNAEFYVFSKLKEDADKNIPPNNLFSSVNDFEKEYENWNFKKENILEDSMQTGNHVYLVKSGELYASSFKTSMEGLLNHPQNILQIGVDVFSWDSIPNAKLVLSIENPDGSEPYHWNAADLDKSLSKAGEWQRAYRCIRLSHTKVPDKNAILKAYIWNSGKDRFLIDDFEVSILEGNKNIYSIYEPIR